MQDGERIAGTYTSGGETETGQQIINMTVNGGLTGTAKRHIRWSQKLLNQWRYSNEKWDMGIEWKEEKTGAKGRTWKWTIDAVEYHVGSRHSINKSDR